MICVSRASLIVREGPDASGSRTQDSYIEECKQICRRARQRTSSMLEGPPARDPSQQGTKQRPSEGKTLAALMCYDMQLHDEMEEARFATCRAQADRKGLLRSFRKLTEDKTHASIPRSHHVNRISSLKECNAALSRFNEHLIDHLQEERELRNALKEAMVDHEELIRVERSAYVSKIALLEGLVTETNEAISSRRSRPRSLTSVHFPHVVIQRTSVQSQLCGSDIPPTVLRNACANTVSRYSRDKENTNPILSLNSMKRIK